MLAVSHEAIGCLKQRKVTFTWLGLLLNKVCSDSLEGFLKVLFFDLLVGDHWVELVAGQPDLEVVVDVLLHLLHSSSNFSEVHVKIMKLTL